jgi:hypothetical protein
MQLDGSPTRCWTTSGGFGLLPSDQPLVGFEGSQWHPTASDVIGQIPSEDVNLVTIELWLSGRDIGAIRLIRHRIDKQLATSDVIRVVIDGGLPTGSD